MPAVVVSSPDAALERVRSICLGFPGAEEKLSHGAPSFHVRGKMFLMFVDDHHHDGRLAVWCKAELEDQRRLVREDAERFFVPPYVGVKGWVGVRLDRPTMDWIGLAILVEEGWLAVAPKSVRQGGGPGRERGVAKAPPKPPPVRAKTDEKVARDALAKLTEICLAFPETARERESQHATFRVRKKTFAYFFDNHHGDGVVGACVKMEKKAAAALVASEPKRFYAPAYIGSKGWVGVRLDGPRVDWRDVAQRIELSYRNGAPKTLVALIAPRARGRAERAPRRAGAQRG